MRIVTLVLNKEINSRLSREDHNLCLAALEQAEEECVDDRLANNYSKDRLNLDQMLLFNFVFDGDKPVLMSGSQEISDNVVRVFSRYYHFKDYRTDGSSMFEKVDDFLELNYALDVLGHYDCIIWTRDKSSAFFKKLKRARPDMFEDWDVHPDKVKILHNNNYQYVFYTGNISSLTHPTM